MKKRIFLLFILIFSIDYPCFIHLCTGMENHILRLEKVKFLPNGNVFDYTTAGSEFEISDQWSKALEIVAEQEKRIFKKWLY